MFEINFVNHEILHKIKTGYIQRDEGRVNTQYKSNKKQRMGTYAVNIVVYEINFEHLIGFSVFSNISSNWS
jgi:hypothetical protein